MVKIRRAYEVLFLGLFLFFLLITDLRYLRGWPVSLFLESTPTATPSPFRPEQSSTNREAQRESLPGPR